jgi:hypothetical protein
MTLPLILSLVTASFCAGGGIRATGYYTPFMIATSCLVSIASGLLTTWKADTGHAKWIGYQVLFGFGLGIGFQQATTTARAVLGNKDAGIGISCVFFLQTLGGSIFLSVGQSIFTSSLVSGLKSVDGNFSAVAVVNTGATELRTIVPPEVLPDVLRVYSHAITNVFYICLAMALLSLVGSGTLEWKKIPVPPKKKKGEADDPEKGEGKAPEKGETKKEEKEEKEEMKNLESAEIKA